MEIEVILAVATLVGAITTVLGFIAGSRERKATVLDKGSSAASNIANAYDKLNTALEDRVDTLEKQRVQAELENQEQWDSWVESTDRQNEIIEELKERIKHLESCENIK